MNDMGFFTGLLIGLGIAGIVSFLVALAWCLCKSGANWDDDWEESWRKGGGGNGNKK